MLNFGLTVSTSTRSDEADVAVAQTLSTVTEEVRVTPVASAAASYAMKDEQAWGWADLRDYVIREIEMRHGPQVRDPKKEAGIFKGFLSRWPEQAIAIARAAFEVHDGMWRNAPISVNRFCRASDQYFAAVIAQRL